LIKKIKMKINKFNSREIARYTFAIFVILLGVFFEYLRLGDKFLEFESVGSWLIYIGIVMIAVITIQFFNNRKRVVDERAIFIANKSTRIVFLTIILFAFLIMILDGIHPITMPYHLFMSWLICGLLIVYFISYKIISRFY